MTLSDDFENTGGELQVSVGGSGRLTVFINFKLRAKAFGDRTCGKILKVILGEQGLFFFCAWNLFCQLMFRYFRQTNFIRIILMLFHQLHPEILEIHHNFVLEQDVNIGDGIRMRSKTDFHYFHAIGEQPVFGDHLSAASDLLGKIFYGLKSCIFCPGVHSNIKEEELKQLPASFSHERTGHHLIIFEMTWKIPVIRVKDFFGHDPAKSPWSAVNVNGGYPVNHKHFFGGKAQRLVQAVLRIVSAKTCLLISFDDLNQVVSFKSLFITNKKRGE